MIFIEMYRISKGEIEVTSVTNIIKHDFVIYIVLLADMINMQNKRSQVSVVSLTPGTIFLFREYRVL